MFDVRLAITQPVALFGGGDIVIEHVVRNVMNSRMNYCKGLEPRTVSDNIFFIGVKLASMIQPCTIRRDWPF